jgi:hypothetical protein
MPIKTQNGISVKWNRLALGKSEVIELGRSHPLELQICLPISKLFHASVLPSNPDQILNLYGRSNLQKKGGSHTRKQHHSGWATTNRTQEKMPLPDGNFRQGHSAELRKPGCRIINGSKYGSTLWLCYPISDVDPHGIKYISRG